MLPGDFNLVWLGSFPIICSYANERHTCQCVGHVVLASAGAVVGPQQAEAWRKLVCRERGIEQATRVDVGERPRDPERWRERPGSHGHQEPLNVVSWLLRGISVSFL